MKNNAIIPIIIVVLLLSLIIPVNNVFADDSTWQFDIWTDKGGEGLKTPGGSYYVGEEINLYIHTSKDCKATLMIYVVPNIDYFNGIKDLKAGTYSLSLGKAKESDIGLSLGATFQASAFNEGQKIDFVSWTVIQPPSYTQKPAQEQQEQEPSALEPSTAPARLIDKDDALEIDVLTALKMANASLSPDAAYDVDNDSSITEEDARQIMYWAVNGVPQELPSAEQQEVIDVFGSPSQFALWYDLDDDTMMDFMVRNEVWYYPDYETCITFIAGIPIGTDSYIPPENETSYPDLLPWDFDEFMTYDQVLNKIGSKSADVLDLLPQSLQTEGFTAYAAGPTVFIMEGSQLAYIQTIGEEKGRDLISSLSFNNDELIKLTNKLYTAMSFLNPLAPQPVMARISFKKFGRWIVRNIKRGAKTIVAVPQKVSRVFPKPLRPIARLYLETQMGNLKAYRIAAKVNDVAALEQNRREWADACNKQAGKIDGDIQKLKQEFNTLENTKPSDMDMTFSQWKERYTLLKDIIPKLEDVSSRLRENGSTFTTKDLLRIGTQQLVKSTLKNIEKAVTQKASEEFNRRLEQSSIRNLLEITAGGTGIDNIVDLFISGRIAKILREMGADPEFKSKIAQSVKGEIKKGKVNLREIDKLIANAVNKLNKESEKLLTEAEGLQDKGNKGNGDTTSEESIDLSSFDEVTFYILIDEFKLSDNSQQTWALEAEMPGRFTGNTFEGYESFTDDQGADITWEFNGTLSEDNEYLTSFTMDYLRVTPEKGGIKARRTEAHITANNLEVRTITDEKIWCYTAGPTASAHSTKINYSTRYGTSNPDTLISFGCKQMCWIDISFLAE